MENKVFTNERILAWLQYFSDNTDIDLEKIKMLDITGKNKNLIPTVKSNRAVMAFTDDNSPDIFYKMWEVGLGECDVWYNEGSEPEGEMKHDKLKDMINRGIKASAGMFIFNADACSTYKIGMDNSNFSRGSVHYLGSEIRAVIMSKLAIEQYDTVCIVSGESIAVEAAIIANMGTVIAVEYSKRDREIMESNINHFGLNNVMIADNVNEEAFRELPVPDMAFIVASASTENEIDFFHRLNPDMRFVIYTLDMHMAAQIPEMLRKHGIARTDTIQVAISHLDTKNMFQTEPAPWLIMSQA